MIINIRGTSGAGKSHTVRSVVAELGGFGNPFGGTDKVPEGYRLDCGLTVLGKYDEFGGGCDTIKTPDRVCELVEQAVTEGRDVIFEGVIVSDTFERYRDLDRRMRARGARTLWCFLDTPLEVCIERIKTRRLAKGNDKPLNEDNTRNRFERIRRVKQKAFSANLNIVDLHYRSAVEQVLTLVRGQ